MTVHGPGSTFGLLKQPVDEAGEKQEEGLWGWEGVKKRVEGESALVPVLIRIGS